MGCGGSSLGRGGHVLETYRTRRTERGSSVGDEPGRAVEAFSGPGVGGVGVDGTGLAILALSAVPRFAVRAGRTFEMRGGGWTARRAARVPGCLAFAVRWAVRGCGSCRAARARGWVEVSPNGAGALALAVARDLVHRTGTLAVGSDHEGGGACAGAVAVAEGVVYSSWGARRGAAAVSRCLAQSGRRAVHLTGRAALAGGRADNATSVARHAFAATSDRPSAADAVAVRSAIEPCWTGVVARPSALVLSWGTHALRATDCRLATCRGKMGGRKRGRGKGMSV